ncbi:MAG: S8 family serine peptidase [Bacteroidales bacterium]|nr:S8 family serine peptidase [Bacteroidales bacterium]
MKIKYIFSLILATLIGVNSFAQSKMAPDIRRHMSLRTGNKSASASSDSLTVMIRTSKADAKALAKTLKSMGVKVSGIIGRHVIGKAPVDSLKRIEALDAVKRIAMPHGAKLRTDNSRRLSRVDDVLNASQPLPQAFTGKGVTVCMIDGGFDFQHPAFSDANGNSRIKAVYSYLDNNGSKVTVKDDGESFELPGSAYLTPDAIATLTTDNTAESHGTHTTSTAAGSHWNGYGGMAPDADIVICYIPDDEAEEDIDNDLEEEEEEEEVDAPELNDLVLGSILFITDYVRNSDKPAVISMSLGTCEGPHNGKGDMPELLQDVVDMGIPIVMSAGNQAGFPLHAYKKLSANNDTMKMVLNTYSYSLESEISAFSRKKADLAVSIDIINTTTGSILYRFPFVSSTAETDEEKVFSSQILEEEKIVGGFFGDILYGTMYDPDIDQTEVSVLVNGGIDDGYGLALNIVGAADTEIDAWDDALSGFEDSGLKGFVKGDDLMSFDDWTTTPGIITVGAYSGTDIIRDTYSQPTTDEYTTVGDIADFSSYGTALNGVTVPTISAPGVSVIAAINRYDTESIEPDKTPAEGMAHDGAFYGAMDGTSMSTPCVSGIVALLLEANPNLSPAEIKTALVANAIKDEFVTASPEKFGAGKVDAMASILYVLDNPSSIRNPKNVLTDSDTYDLTGRKVRQMNRHGLYISGGKKVLAY